MILIEKKMDLFELTKEYTLVHCISEDCAMGAGIAKVFNKKFRNMKSDIKETLINQELSYPVSILYIGEDQDVFNMVTKEKYWNKPTYNNFLHALLDVVEICKCNNIKKLGMPKIGCGLDWLEWSKVKEMIRDNFEDLDIDLGILSKNSS